MNNDGSTTIYGGMLNEVVISSNHSSGGYGYSSSGGFSSNGFLNDPYFMNSQFWDGSGYGSSGYSGGGGGGGYYVSTNYVAGSGSSSSGGGVHSPGTSWLNSVGNSLVESIVGGSGDDNPYRNWDATALANVFNEMGTSISTIGIVLTATGIGAEVGIPMMLIGGRLSDFGTAIELAVDINGNTWESFDGEKWMIKGGFKVASSQVGSWNVLPEEARAVYEGWDMASQYWIDYMRQINE